SQFQLVLLVKFGYRRGHPFTDYSSRPSVDSAFPHIVVLIGFHLVGQLTRLTVKAYIDDFRIFVLFRCDPYRLSKGDFRFLEGLYYFLSGYYVRLRRALCKSRSNGAHDEEREDSCLAHEEPPSAVPAKQALKAGLNVDAPTSDSGTKRTFKVLRRRSDVEGRADMARTLPEGDPRYA